MVFSYTKHMGETKNGQAAPVPHSLYVEQLLRADRLQQEVSRLTDELKKTRGQLADATEAKERAERVAVRAVAERDAAWGIDRSEAA